MKKRNYIWVTTLIVLLLWGLIAYKVDNEVKMPSPIRTLEALTTIIGDKNFITSVAATLKRSLIGFVIAFSLALVLGILSGVSNGIFYLIRPIVIAGRSIPTMAVILVALIWLGRDVAPVLVSVMIIFPIIYSAVVNGIREVDKKLLEMTRVYKLSRYKKLRYLYLPSIRSSLLAVSAAAISFNFKITVAAEVLGQPGRGIGTGFQIEKMTVNTAGKFAWAIVAIVIGA